MPARHVQQLAGEQRSPAGFGDSPQAFPIAPHATSARRIALARGLRIVSVAAIGLLAATPAVSARSTVSDELERNLDRDVDNGARDADRRQPFRRWRSSVGVSRPRRDARTVRWRRRVLRRGARHQGVRRRVLRRVQHLRRQRRNRSRTARVCPPRRRGHRPRPSPSTAIPLPIRWSRHRSWTSSCRPTTSSGYRPEKAFPSGTAGSSSCTCSRRAPRHHPWGRSPATARPSPRDRRLAAGMRPRRRTNAPSRTNRPQRQPAPRDPNPPRRTTP